LASRPGAARLAGAWRVAIGRGVATQGPATAASQRLCPCCSTLTRPRGSAKNSAAGPWSAAISISGVPQGNGPRVQSTCVRPLRPGASASGRECLAACLSTSASGPAIHPSLPGGRLPLLLLVAAGLLPHWFCTVLAPYRTRCVLCCVARAARPHSVLGARGTVPCLPGSIRGPRTAVLHVLCWARSIHHLPLPPPPTPPPPPSCSPFNQCPLPTLLLHSPPPPSPPPLTGGPFFFLSSPSALTPQPPSPSLLLRPLCISLSVRRTPPSSPRSLPRILPPSSPGSLFLQSTSSASRSSSFARASLLRHPPPQQHQHPRVPNRLHFRNARGDNASSRKL